MDKNRRIFQSLNEQFATTGLQCEGGNIDSNAFCDIADYQATGARVNPKNGEVEAELTKPDGRKFYLNTDELADRAKVIIQRVQNQKDSLTVTNPVDLANSEQLMNGLQKTINMSDDIAAQSSTPAVITQPQLLQNSVSAPPRPVMALGQ